MMNETMIGVDLAKVVFQVHGALMTGNQGSAQSCLAKASPNSKQPSALFVMEACGSARHWALEIIRLGHEVRSNGCEAPHSDLPDLMRDECRDLLEQIAEQTVRINARTEKIKALSAETDTARRLRSIPEVVPMAALAVEAFAPSMESFNRGRACGAWLGLVPRQSS